MLRRDLILPWLLASVTMYAISYVWHGVALTDLHEITIPLGLYLGLAGLVYMIIGLVMVVAVDRAIVHNIIPMRAGFPLRTMGFGAITGFAVYLVVFIMGMSFADHGMVHVLADVLWQMLEQSIGGLVMGQGIVHVVRKRQLEMEGA